MKTCPVCHAHCFDDMEVCYGCLHRFAEDGAAMQAVQGGVPADNAMSADDPAEEPTVNDARCIRRTSDGGQPAEPNDLATDSPQGLDRSAMAGARSHAQPFTIEVLPRIELPNGGEELALQGPETQTTSTGNARDVPEEAACIQLVINLRPVALRSAAPQAVASTR